MPLELTAKPLTKRDFSAYGDVIETEGARHFPINAGTIERFHDLARVDTGGGRPVISIVTCNRTASLPVRVDLVERHRLGSQAFIPLGFVPMVVVVGPPAPTIEPGQLAAFVSNGRQGVNYHAGVWHMPLVAFEEGQRFLVVDRGDGGDCEEKPLDHVEVIVHSGDQGT